MSRMMDADKFLSWLSEVEGEIRKEKMKDCQPDRYDDGLMAATETVREYVEKMSRIDGMEKIAVAAMKKQIPKRPVTYTPTNRADCPVCGETVRGIDKPYGKYCGWCGQRLDWSDEQ